jgi:hypothetical protein
MPMNYLAHLAVATATSASPRYGLGAILSDLCAMSGLRCTYGRLPGEVAAGVQCHRAADRAFHADPVFLAGAGAIRSAALAAGLPPGASRAIGHAGWELLLDGTPAVGWAGPWLVAALGEWEGATVAFDPADRATWRRLTEGMAAERPWTASCDPEVVAVRLWRALGRRPRLRFERRDQAVVANLLAQARPSVLAQAPPLMERVIGRLAERPDGPEPAER